MKKDPPPQIGPTTPTPPTAPVKSVKSEKSKGKNPPPTTFSESTLAIVKRKYRNLNKSILVKRGFLKIEQVYIEKQNNIYRVLDYLCVFRTDGL